MKIKELTINEFEKYSEEHQLTSYYQTQYYAMIMSECKYEYELIGYVKDDKIYAATLILKKAIGKFFYGYAPRGFLIDYNNNQLLESFTEDLKKYLFLKKYSFLKINPNIIVKEIDKKNYEETLNENFKIKKTLQELGYNKLKDNLYFESMLPRFTAIINLKKLSINNLSKNTRNKIKKAIRKGLTFEKGNLDDISILNEFLEEKSYIYNDFYNTFKQNNNVEIFKVTLNKRVYLENAQFFYNNELDKNIALNELMIYESTTNNINKKMNSDITLLSYKKDIMESTKMCENYDGSDLVVGVALVHVTNSKVELIASGYDKEYKRFMPNYFIHYSLINHYKDTHKTMNIGGISGDFTNESPFRGLNRFKIGFNPKIYEYIGEFDLVVNERQYNTLLRSRMLSKEFKK